MVAGDTAGDRSRATLQEVARLAEVSRSTTSRVLNDHPGVRPEVRARVRRVMDEVGYVPDSVARSLRRGRSGVIGLVIPQPAATVFSDAYFAALVAAVVRAAQVRDWTVALVMVDDPHDPHRARAATGPDRMVERVTNGGLLDGVIVTASVEGDTTPGSLVASGVPVVLIGEPSPDPSPEPSHDPSLEPGPDPGPERRPASRPDSGSESGSPSGPGPSRGRTGRLVSVDVDNARGGELAAAHLAALGRRRLAIIAGPGSSASARRRAEGARRAAAAGSLDIVVDIAATSYAADAGRAAMVGVLDEGASVDGVVAGNDAIAYGVVQALRGAGRGVPDDVAVVGFDDLGPATLAEPPLTTVRQPVDAVAVAAVQGLADLVGHRRTVDRHVLDVELVVRGSAPAVDRHRPCAVGN